MPPATCLIVAAVMLKVCRQAEDEFTVGMIANGTR